jgi:hypothetical protein
LLFPGPIQIPSGGSFLTTNTSLSGSLFHSQTRLALLKLEVPLAPGIIPTKESGGKSIGDFTRIEARIQVGAYSVDRGA